jgi:hypothetical protein
MVGLPAATGRCDRVLALGASGCRRIPTRRPRPCMDERLLRISTWRSLQSPSMNGGGRREGAQGIVPRRGCDSASTIRQSRSGAESVRIALHRSSQGTSDGYAARRSDGPRRRVCGASPASATPTRPSTASVIFGDPRHRNTTLLSDPSVCARGSATETNRRTRSRSSSSWWRSQIEAVLQDRIELGGDYRCQGPATTSRDRTPKRRCLAGVSMRRRSPFRTLTN